MRKFVIALLSACLGVPAFASSPGFTTVVATSITDATGNALVSGTATFQVVDASGHPLPVKLTGGGQIITEPVSVAVTNGTFTANVVDVSQTQPSFPCVSLNIIDNSTGSTVWSNSCLQPTGSSYSLDNFSTNTTPILPQAGDTVQGNLGINGSLNVTGALTTGAFVTSALQANTTNGTLNASLYGGADILAQAQTAFAACSSDCTAFIPAGSYTATTTLTLPNTQNRYALVMDPGAVIHYTGTGNAIEGPTIAGGTNHGDLITGGWIIGTASGQNGIHINPINNLIIRDVKVSGFTNTASQLVGNGILDAGGNSIEIEDVNLFGNHTGLGGTEVTGYSSIGVHLIDSDLSENSGWGIATFDNHVNATQENTWVIENNIIEQNGAGGIDLAHSNDATIKANHFEQSGIPIRLNNGYNGTNNKVEGNFFISGSDHSYQIQVVAGFQTKIDSNFETQGSGLSPCFVGVVNAADIDLQHNTTVSTSQTCYPGTAGGWLAQFNHKYRNFVPDQNVINDSGASVTLSALGTAVDLPGTGYSNGAIVMLVDGGSHAYGLFLTYKSVGTTYLGGSMTAGQYTVSWDSTNNLLNVQKNSGTVPATIHYAVTMIGG